RLPPQRSRRLHHRSDSRRQRRAVYELTKKSEDRRQKETDLTPTPPLQQCWRGGTNAARSTGASFSLSLRRERVRVRGSPAGMADITAPDPRAILTALGVDDVTAIQPVSGGWDTALWKVERPGGAFALRVFPPGREDDCRREAAVMRAAVDGGVPVPRVRAGGGWQGRAGLALGWGARGTRPGAVPC